MLWAIVIVVWCCAAMPMSASASPAPQLLAASTPVAADQCGRSVATGDINGDGMGDVIMGCPQDDTGFPDAGNVVVFLRTGGGSFSAGIELANPSPVAMDYCGYSVAVGDVNGDGHGDIIMGCYMDDTGVANAGNVVVFTRNLANTGFDPAVELANPSPALNDYCGYSLAVGDVNGDTHADIVMGCEYDDTGALDAGNVVVFTRNAGNTGFNPAVELANPTPVAVDSCGHSVAVSDVNADNYADIVMGCSGDDTGASLAGNVVLFTRNAANTGFDVAVELAGPTPVGGEECGTSVAIGDVNGDTRKDIVMGCPNDATAGSYSGNAVLFTRNAGNNGFDSPIELASPSPTANEYCGASVVVGKLNQSDNYGDVAIGCPGTTVGGSFVQFNRGTGNTGFDPGIEIVPLGVSPGDSCGSSITAGDVDQDTFADPVLGCVTDDVTAPDQGTAVVFPSQDTLSISLGTWVDMGPGYPGATTVSASTTVTWDTNNPNGAKITVTSLTTPALRSGGSTFADVGAGPASLSSGTFGACLYSTVSAIAMWTVTACNPFDWYSVTTTPSDIARTPSAGSGSATLRYGANAAPNQPPGNYSATIMYTVVAL